ncbi:protein ImuB [Sphingomonas insulae]|uniref:DNA-directed DNA polymerase n=1 Tax=Sphingomonas insulae TaxID=424800 RepID=A0ABP3STU1_9SPHN|nr:DNA polymerase Y family protein [Sphingomonas insulae]NIJ30017.1 protein ImuB [Sphingomonas insulae]
MPRVSVERRYLALVFPWLPIERLRATRPHLFAGRGETPVAFTETIGNAVRLTATDLAAARAGLGPGLTLADARARVPELEVFPADPHADMDWLERLADGCTRYSPTVALMPPDALVIDIAGCIHAFEGERPLAADVEARMARRGILARHAFGDTPEIARALARYAGAPAPDESRAVKRLPVVALELDDDATVALARAGLKTVGDVMARPLAGIAARFGEEAATAVRRLSGDHKAPVRARVRVAPVAVERRFAEPIAHTDYALDVIEELAAEAAATLAERHQGGRRWEARLFRSDGHIQSLRIETGMPTRDVPLLMRLFAERIDTLADPLDPGYGYDLIRLDVALAERLDAAQLRLEGGAARQDQVAQLVDQLSTRLGRERVRRFAPRDSHIPEQAELMLPAAADAPAGVWPQAEAGEPALRPIYLFDPPQRIESVMAEVPDGPPHRFRWRRRVHEVARSEGPERIAGEWWRRHDTVIPTRDYYRVEDRRGRRFWIFRHGLYDEQEHPRWYLHGLFA